MNTGAKPKNKLLWLFEPFDGDPRYVQTRMFGCIAAYLDGSIYLAIADRTEPWNGMLAATSHDRHAALRTDFPQLHPHPVVSKWLYLSQSHPEFEGVASKLVELVLARDPRLGVEPKPKRQAVSR